MSEARHARADRPPPGVGGVRRGEAAGRRGRAFEKEGAGSPLCRLEARARARSGHREAGGRAAAAEEKGGPACSRAANPSPLRGVKPRPPPPALIESARAPAFHPLLHGVS